MRTPAGPRPIAETVARQIRVRLAADRKTGKQLAQHMGLTQDQLSRRIIGRTPIGIDELAAAADFFGIGVTDLTHPEGEPR